MDKQRELMAFAKLLDAIEKEDCELIGFKALRKDGKKSVIVASQFTAELIYEERMDQNEFLKFMGSDIESMSYREVRMYPVKPNHFGHTES